MDNKYEEKKIKIFLEGEKIQELKLIEYMYILNNNLKFIEILKAEEKGNVKVFIDNENPNIITIVWLNTKGKVIKTLKFKMVSIGI
jgi:hypothetical protein